MYFYALKFIAHLKITKKWVSYKNNISKTTKAYK